MPPAASISWNNAQAVRQSWSVKSSTLPEPADGSATLARCDFSSRTSCVLRAMRRAKRSGNPSAAVNGRTVIASAPPNAAAKAAMRGAEDIHLRIAPRQHPPCGLGRDESRAGASPHAVSTRAHSFRSAAEFRDGEKLIGIGGEAKEDHARARHRARCLPLRARADRQAATASTNASSCASEPPAL